jgi:hypothetical protein
MEIWAMWVFIILPVLAGASVIPGVPHLSGLRSGTRAESGRAKFGQTAHIIS